MHKLRARWRNRRLRNRTQLNRNSLAYYYRHRDEQLRKARENYLKNKDKWRERAKKWLAKNPGYKASQSAKRRAARNGSTINPDGIRKFIQAVKSKRWFVCYYCKRKCSTRKVHFDHVAALRGPLNGKHEVGNLCASCPKCNLQKGAKPIGQWQPALQTVLPI